MGACQSSTTATEIPLDTTAPHDNRSLPDTDQKANPKEEARTTAKSADAAFRNLTPSTTASSQPGHHPKQSSDAIGLEEIMKTLKKDGALSETVVRMETPLGVPIEEVYAGVHDGPVLGSGISGIVRLVKHRATGIDYAVKSIDLDLFQNEEALKQLRNEIYIMCQVDHPNVVRLEEVYESDSEIYLVQELCLGGDLFDRLDEQQDFHYTESRCARLVKEMLSSVRYLHTKKIIHRDLKLENFLFESTKPDSELKLIDFGLSKHFQFGEVHHEAVGTPYTVAPEVIKGSYDERCDCWSIGVIAYLLLSGETPFGGVDGEDLLSVKNAILRGSFAFQPEDIWVHVSDSAKHFIKTLLVVDYHDRPSAKEAQMHPWLERQQKNNGNGRSLNPRVVEALVSFKEYSDLRKILCEVLSFTLLPDQIKDLRTEFEKLDNGDGEITLSALKQVLSDNAESGSLGGLTEQEVEDIFNALRVQKTETTVRWHEFIAAGLSQCEVDERNLRLAFERLDTDRKGFITFDDVGDLMGSHGEQSTEALKIMWTKSMQENDYDLERISYEDFLRLMRSQPEQDRVRRQGSFIRRASMRKLGNIPEGSPPGPGMTSAQSRRAVSMTPLHLDSESKENVEMPPSFARHILVKQRSRSLDESGSAPMVPDEEQEDLFPRPPLLKAHTTRTLALPGRRGGDFADVSWDEAQSPLVANKQLYRALREMRLGVLDASKRFEEKKASRARSAGLVMRRGMPSGQKEQDLVQNARRRSGRTRKHRTASDLTGMVLTRQEAA